ncbi:MAG: hypothetical protein BECKG1743F_GA0114225_109221, partial [Candidatus Kentron sp. G]
KTTVFYSNVDLRAKLVAFVCYFKRNYG